MAKRYIVFLSIFFTFLVSPKLALSKLAAPKWEQGFPRVNETSLELRWSPVANAIYYRIYYNNIKIEDLKENSYKYVTPLPTKAGAYLYWVTAVDASGEEGYIKPVRLQISIQYGIPIYSVERLKENQYFEFNNKVFLKEASNPLVFPGYKKKSRSKWNRSQKIRALKDYKSRSISGKLLSVSDRNFRKEVLNSTIPVLVDFWAPWCKPCQIIHPILRSLAREYSNRIKIVRMNTGNNRKFPERYNIYGLPTLVMFKNGKEVGRLTGAVPKSYIKRLIEANL